MTGFDLYKPLSYLRLSWLVEFTRCPRKFFYDAGCGLRLPDDRPALLFGEAIHYAVGRWWETHDLSEALAAFDKIWDPSLDDKKRSRARAGMMLMDWLANKRPGYCLYEIEEPPVLPDAYKALRESDTFSAFEIPWAMDIGLDIPLVGRIDGWARHRDTRKRWVVEYKTASEASQRLRWLDGFTLSPQVLAYTTAAGIITGEEIEGCFVEGLKVAVKETDTILQPVYVQPWHKEDFLQWARWKGTEILACQQLKQFPKQFTGCHPYSMFGQPGYLCDYQRLCLVEDWTDLANTYVTSRDGAYVVPTVNGSEA